ncbi:sigma factor [Streptomyces sp. NPDC005166]
MLSFATIKAAQNHEELGARLTAQREVIEHIESRVTSLATQAARRMSPQGGARYADYRDEFAQVGRVAVFEALDRFADTTVDAFERFVYTTVQRTLLDAVRAERNFGADDKAVKTFASMLELADGDTFEAARLAQTVPPKGSGYRLSAQRANAARLAWQGAVSLDKTYTDGSLRTSGGVGQDESSLKAVLGVWDEEVDGEIRPKVGRGAVIEAAHVLERYVTVPTDHKDRKRVAHALHYARAGFATPDTVEALEDVISVPRDPNTRRYVLDAMAVLAAAVSTATEGAVDDELMGAADVRRADDSEKHARVNSVLDSMGAAQRNALVHSFGIGDVLDFGWGDGCDMAGICALLGQTPVNLRQNRKKGRQTFAKRYVAVVALDKPAYAAVLAAAAAANLTHGGRK